MFKQISEMGHEQVVFCHDKATGYRGIIAIHDTTLGPALGGTRFWHYASDVEAVTDALRLAKGMTYKNAVAGLNLGGGKSVIIGNNKTTRREYLFRAHGRFVDSLGGRYITAEDVGTNPTDMDFVHMETQWVAGLQQRSGDPSPVTARGVFRAIQATAKVRWGSDDLAGKHITVQGLGSVGFTLCRHLVDSGARITVTDIDAARIEKAVHDFRAAAVKPDEIYGVEADIFAPCALGAVVNDDTMPKFKVAAIAGAANNQLLEPRHGDELEARGILYAPDYVVNAGGVINVYSELTGWSSDRALRKADEIYDTVQDVFEIARDKKIPTYLAADRLAERRIESVRAMVRTWPQLPRKS